MLCTAATNRTCSNMALSLSSLPDRHINLDDQSAVSAPCRRLRNYCADAWRRCGFVRMGGRLDLLAIRSSSADGRSNDRRVRIDNAQAPRLPAQSCKRVMRERPLRQHRCGRAIFARERFQARLFSLHRPAVSAWERSDPRGCGCAGPQLRTENVLAPRRRMAHRDELRANLRRQHTRRAVSAIGRIAARRRQRTRGPREDGEVSGKTS